MERRSVAYQRSIRGDAARVLLREVRNIGGDEDAILEKAGLRHLSERIRSWEDLELPRRQFTLLAQAAIMTMHYHASARDARPPLPVPHLQLMAQTMLPCPDIARAIESAGRFLRLIDPDFRRIHLVHEGDMCRLHISSGITGTSASDMLVTFCGIAAFYRLLCWLAGATIPLHSVSLAHAPMESQDIINTLFRLTPEMHQRTSCIRFPARYLSWPVVRNYTELFRLFDVFPFDLLPYMGEEHRLSEMVRADYISALASGEALPDAQRLADKFGLSLATFKRRLNAEQVSLGRIKTACRQKLARRLLANGHMSVKEVAAAVQYTDTATFRRAFREWTGVTPAEYRASPPA